MSSALALITGDIANSKAAFMSALSNKSISFERESGFAIQMNRETAISLILVFLLLGLVGTVDITDQQAAHEHKVETINAARVK